eukprot:CAMPEP_0198288718 /NCGR_PEP_ID=MMETSP1449-20131203/7136_1 /TAXON_ID=420275 /ORGANISM="Attheya septentrionalis, Strain CCMP2084" /LENGTH=193 /DNA_ID=CAMNT_0043986917 /DNA_START=122 /DNA_END=703 /DNA_ORIENTATION=-
MSEETKTDGDYEYVNMGDGGAATGRKQFLTEGLDDPNLSQEDKDHRMAIALQQQENAAVYDAHKKKHEQAIAAKTNRTARSGTFTRLAAVRDKDHGALRVPSAYTTDNASSAYASHTDESTPYDASAAASMGGARPQEIADAQLAMEMQKLEQVGAGTVQEMQKIIKEGKADSESQVLRTGRSNYNKPKNLKN